MDGCEQDHDNQILWARFAHDTEELNMARQKVRSAIQLTSWAEVNDALRQLGENRRDLKAIENVMNERIASAKADADAKSASLMEDNKQLELAIKEYSLQHRGDMGNAKSKVLTFGKVSFRITRKIQLPSAASKVEAIIKQLLESGKRECVVYPAPKIDKEALKKYSAQEIAEVGAKLVVEDVFGYEVDETALPKR